MMLAAGYADEANRRVHNADVKSRKAEIRTRRAARAVKSLRATLSLERARAREAEDLARNLIALINSAESRGLVPAAGFLEMHLRVLIRTLGGE